MTNEQAEALGRRWIAAGGGWCDGMLVVDAEGIPVRVYAADPYYPLAVRAGDGRARPSCGAIVGGGPEGGAWIDFRDGATKGAALDVVRERWDAPLASLVNERSNRWAVLFLGGPVVHGATEAEALVAALEAAPSTTRGTDAGTTGTGRQ